jgi:hypothetical protein
MRTQPHSRRIASVEYPPVRNIASLAGEIELIVADARGSIVGFVAYTAPYTEREPMFPPDWAVIRMSRRPEAHPVDSRASQIGGRLADEYCPLQYRASSHGAGSRST